MTSLRRHRTVRRSAIIPGVFIALLSAAPPAIATQKNFSAPYSSTAISQHDLLVPTDGQGNVRPPCSHDSALGTCSNMASADAATGRSTTRVHVRDPYGLESASPGASAGFVETFELTHPARELALTATFHVNHAVAAQSGGGLPALAHPGDRVTASLWLFGQSSSAACQISSDGCGQGGAWEEVAVSTSPDTMVEVSDRDFTLVGSIRPLALRDGRIMPGPITISAGGTASIQRMPAEMPSGELTAAVDVVVTSIQVSR